MSLNQLLESSKTFDLTVFTLIMLLCHLCALLVVACSYTEHSTVGLAQQWDQLDQLCMRMQHNLEQQIQAWLVSCVIFME